MMTTADKSERGISIVEVLVVASLFSIVGLCLVSSNRMMTETRGRILHNSTASQIAIEGLEKFAGIDPVTLTASNGSTNTIVRSGASYRQSIAITVNSDGSRTVNVAVTCPSCRFAGSATVSTNLPKWGSV